MERSDALKKLVNKFRKEQDKKKKIRKKFADEIPIRSLQYIAVPQLFLGPATEPVTYFAGKELGKYVISGAKKDPKKALEAFFKDYNFQGELIKTSAKTGENVEHTFEMLSREILKNSLNNCPNCGNLYPVEQKFCQYCGRKTK